MLLFQVARTNNLRVNRNRETFYGIVTGEKMVHKSPHRNREIFTIQVAWVKSKTLQNNSR